MYSGISLLCTVYLCHQHCYHHWRDSRGARCSDESCSCFCLLLCNDCKCMGNVLRKSTVYFLLYPQAFIHPSLARIFWSSRSDPGPFVWSPYETCDGTFTATKDHRFTSLVNKDLGVEYVFFDFAGSGLVHVCGKLNWSVWECWPVYHLHLLIVCM